MRRRVSKPNFPAWRTYRIRYVECTRRVRIHTKPSARCIAFFNSVDHFVGPFSCIHSHASQSNFFRHIINCVGFPLCSTRSHTDTRAHSLVRRIHIEYHMGTSARSTSDASTVQRFGLRCVCSMGHIDGIVRRAVRLESNVVRLLRKTNIKFSQRL